MRIMIRGAVEMFVDLHMIVETEANRFPFGILVVGGGLRHKGGFVEFSEKAFSRTGNLSERF